MQTDEESWNLYLSKVKKDFIDTWLRWSSEDKVKVILVSSFLAFSLQDVLRESFSGIKNFSFVFAVYYLKDFAFKHPSTRRAIRACVHCTFPKLCSLRSRFSKMYAACWKKADKRTVLDCFEATINIFLPALVIFSVLYILLDVSPSIVAPLVTLALFLLLTINFISRCLLTSSTSENCAKPDIKGLRLCQESSQNGELRTPDNEVQACKESEEKEEYYSKDTELHRCQELTMKYCSPKDYYDHEELEKSSTSTETLLKNEFERNEKTRAKSHLLHPHQHGDRELKTHRGTENELLKHQEDSTESHSEQEAIMEAQCNHQEKYEEPKILGKQTATESENQEQETTGTECYNEQQDNYRDDAEMYRQTGTKNESQEIEKAETESYPENQNESGKNEKPVVNIYTENELEHKKTEAKSHPEHQTKYITYEELMMMQEAWKEIENQDHEFDNEYQAEDKEGKLVKQTETENECQEYKNEECSPEYDREHKEQRKEKKKLIMKTETEIKNKEHKNSATEFCGKEKDERDEKKVMSFRNCKHSENKENEEAAITCSKQKEYHGEKKELLTQTREEKENQENSAPESCSKHKEQVVVVSRTGNKNEIPDQEEIETCRQHEGEHRKEEELMTRAGKGCESPEQEETETCSEHREKQKEQEQEETETCSEHREKQKEEEQEKLMARTERENELPEQEEPETETSGEHERKQKKEGKLVTLKGKEYEILEQEEAETETCREHERKQKKGEELVTLKGKEYEIPEQEEPETGNYREHEEKHNEMEELMMRKGNESENQEHEGEKTKPKPHQRHYDEYREVKKREMQTVTSNQLMENEKNEIESYPNYNEHEELKTQKKTESENQKYEEPRAQSYDEPTAAENNIGFHQTISDRTSGDDYQNDDKILQQESMKNCSSLHLTAKSAICEDSGKTSHTSEEETVKTFKQKTSCISNTDPHQKTRKISKDELKEGKKINQNRSGCRKSSSKVLGKNFQPENELKKAEDQDQRQGKNDISDDQSQTSSFIESITNDPIKLDFLPQNQQFQVDAQCDGSLQLKDGVFDFHYEVEPQYPLALKLESHWKKTEPEEYEILERKFIFKKYKK